LGFALPPARPIFRLRAAGAANHQTFWSSDLPVKSGFRTEHRLHQELEGDRKAWSMAMKTATHAASAAYTT